MPSGKKGVLILSEPERKYKPSGRALDVFDQKAVGKFQSDLYNLPYLRDQATKRNKIYLVIIIILILALVYVCMTAKFKTYVVRVNDTTGEVYAGQELKAKPYEPKQAEIEYFLRQFIRDTRTVPNDMVVLRKNWERASHYLTPAAAQKYNGLVEKEGRSISFLRGKMIEPTVNTLQLQPGMDRTYQIRWIEESFSSDTDVKISYSGLFTVVIEEPKDPAQLAVNPLGLKISELTYQKEDEKILNKLSNSNPQAGIGAVAPVAPAQSGQ